MRAANWKMEIALRLISEPYPFFVGIGALDVVVTDERRRPVCRVTEYTSGKVAVYEAIGDTWGVVGRFEIDDHDLVPRTLDLMIELSHAYANRQVAKVMES